MSGNITQINNLPVTITGGGGNFTSSPFFGYLWIYVGSLATPVISGQLITFGTVAANTGNIINLTPVTLSTPLFRGTNYIFNMAFPIGVTSTGLGQILATVTFNDIPNTTRSATLVRPVNLPSPPGGTGYFATSPPTFNPNCLHGSSLVQMRDGIKRIDKIDSGDEVLSHDLNGNKVYAKVEYLSTCWLTFMGVDHDAIIFEKDSLGPNQPDRQLIIDPGHPMCTEEEYLQDGIEALRPAGTYWEELNGKTIYSKKWTDIFVDDEPSVRYDLILEEPFNTYIANGMVIRAKGYKDHRYKEFV